MITGADRIAANGDTANKIGTYGLAVLARHHGIPFVIVAPTSTIDPGCGDRRRDPDRGARRSRGDDRVPGPQPRVRRHPRRPDHSDRDGGGRPSRPLRRLASRSGALAMILDEVDPEARADPRAPRVRRERRSSCSVRDSPTGRERRAGTSLPGVVEPPLPSDLTALAGARASPGSPRPSRRGRRRSGRGRSRWSCSPGAWRPVSAAASRRWRRRSTAAASSR